MTQSHHLILASASPRRQELLGSWGIDFTLKAPEIDESLTPGLSCGPQAESLARQKAECVAFHLDTNVNNTWVLGADTLVAQSEALLGKPENEEHALEMLQSLSGAEVEVATGVALVAPQFDLFAGYVSTKLLMKPFSESEAMAYVATGEPMGKAGAFAIQGIGKSLIAERWGSYSNVVGLPRSLVFELFWKSGFRS